MNDSEKIRVRSRRFERYAWVLAVVWTVVVAASLVWNVVQVRQNTLGAARIQARAAFEKDVIYRRWNAKHGGVYAPVTEETQPNPYLDVPERDVTTPLRRPLTLINPAYMTRQVHELAEEKYGVLGHITSLNPIRPQNASDPWETEALQAFEQGKTEVSSVEKMEGKEYIRLMRPLITEKSCLKCHAAQGYQRGDIRGGISVSVPMEPLLAISRIHVLTLVLGHVLLWLMGLVGIVSGTQRLRRSERERTRAAEALHKAHDELERRVEERTAELDKANASLKAEIAERKRVEDEIRTQSKFLQTAIDALTHPFYTINVKDYSISLFNKAAGINISEKTSTCYALAHGRSEPCRKDDHPCPIEEIKVTGRPTTVEHIHLDKNGNKRNIEINAFPIFDKEGNLSQIIEYSIDITERKKAEAELRKHREQLEDLVKERTNELEATQEELVKHEKLSVLGQLTAMVSHELRNPLGVIRSSAFYLESKLDSANEKITKHLKRIEEQVGLCDSIIDELLEYTTGRSSVMDKGEMTPWIEEVLDQMTIPDQVSLVRKLSHDLPIVRFDREKMRRVVINLVDNAVQALIVRQESWKGGKGPYRPQVKVATFMVENGVCIEVEDNGIGMDEETAGQAFEPLFTTQARGTGLGLAIVKKIIDEHGGSISLKSEPDRGTKVTVKIPLLTRQQEQADGK